jgi:predicted amidophosphoribosyltransferase
MPSVAELSAPYANFMLAPRPGAGVCRTCFNLTDGYDRCYACTHIPRHVDAVAPISYSVAHEQLHHALAAYKRLDGTVARRLAIQLAAVLWRYLERHEPCLARTAGTANFDRVTTVPSGDPQRNENHPLRRLVSGLVEPTRERYERLLERTDTPAEPHEYSADKFAATRELTGGAVLLIDDTWTTGASAQSAAAALKAAGAATVAAVVIGRHVNRDWRENDRLLRSIERPFDWDRCAYCSRVDAPENGS